MSAAKKKVYNLEAVTALGLKKQPAGGPTIYTVRPLVENGVVATSVEMMVAAGRLERWVFLGAPKFTAKKELTDAMFSVVKINQTTGLGTDVFYVTMDELSALYVPGERKYTKRIDGKPKFVTTPHPTGKELFSSLYLSNGVLVDLIRDIRAQEPVSIFTHGKGDLESVVVQLDIELCKDHRLL